MNSPAADTTPIAAPWATPLYMVAKPAGPTCNMACDYCYYTEKKRLFAQGGPKNMSEATLEQFTRLYLQSQPTGHAVFCWHGGEAMLRPLDFYRRALQLQQTYGKGIEIENCIQTNGTLLTDEWCRFLADNDWLVGLSIDGEADFHDYYRRLRTGAPSHRKAMQAAAMLNRHNVRWNAMAVVNDYNADFPDEFYRFFRSIDCRYIQFAPIVERITPQGTLARPGQEGRLAPFAVTPRQWGDFLIRIFDLWIKADVGRVFIQLFDSTLALTMGVEPGVCTMARQCGHAGVVEHNGDVYACDHFVFEPYKLGNIHSQTLVEMMGSQRQADFGSQKWRTLPPQCLQCQWLRLCNGECPKNRFNPDPAADQRLNYLCHGYRRFFEHSAPWFERMASLIRQGRAPAEVML